MNSPDKKLTPPRGPATEDARITAALEHKPEPQIPIDFAARTAARASAQPLRRDRRMPRFGSAIALISVPLAALALFVLATHAAPSLHSIGFDLELALLGELAFLGWWISRTFNQRFSG